MGTENSSAETRGRAKELADAIGAYHVDLNMDTCVKAVADLFTFVTNRRPKFKVHGGTNTENLALQNIQVIQKFSNFVLALLILFIRQD